MHSYISPEFQSCFFINYILDGSRGETHFPSFGMKRKFESDKL